MLLPFNLSIKHGGEAAGERPLANAAVKAAANSAKYFVDEVKAKSGVGKLLEIEMMSLQLTFTNSVLRSVRSLGQGGVDSFEILGCRSLKEPRDV